MALNKHILYGTDNADGTFTLHIGAVGDDIPAGARALADVTFNKNEFGLIERLGLREFEHIVDSTGNEAAQSVAAAVVESIPVFHTPSGIPPGGTQPVAGAIVQPLAKVKDGAVAQPAKMVDADTGEPATNSTKMTRTQASFDAAKAAGDPVANSNPGDNPEGASATQSKPAGVAGPAPATPVPSNPTAKSPTGTVGETGTAADAK